MRALVSDRNIITRILNAATGASVCGPGGRVRDDIPTPVIEANEILVKVKAVALNPTDFKHLEVASPPTSIMGCDFAGEVLEVGQSTGQRWKVGDRVAGVVHGGIYPDKGAFAEYLKADASLAWHIPDFMSDVDATTYGISAVTAMLSLNVRFRLPFPEEQGAKLPPHGPTILIYAGATSAGLFHIQVAKAAGCTVVTTASPRSFDLVKKYGADAVFDYNSNTLIKDILHHYPRIAKAVDCFSEGKSTLFCAKVLEPNGGKVLTLLQQDNAKVPGVEQEVVMMYTLFGKAFQLLPPFGPKWKAQPEDRDSLARFYEALPRLTHILKPIPVKELKPGFDGILDGLEKLRRRQVSGGKQVVRLL